MNKKILFSFLIIFISILVLWPVFWIVMFSIRPDSEVFGVRPTWIPQQFTLRNFYEVIFKFNARGVRFYHFLLNSIIASGLATVFSLTASLLGGYAISRFQFFGKKIFIYLIFITQLLPGIVYLLPYYTMISYFRLLDTKYSLILSYIIFGLPICTWMMRSYIDDIPAEIDSAAMIDGANYHTIIFRIIFPIVLPGLISVGIFSFILGWNDYLFASVLVKGQSMWTLPLALNSFNGMYGMDWGNTIAFGVLVSVPVIAVFFYLQKNIARGITAGAVKG